MVQGAVNLKLCLSTFKYFRNRMKRSCEIQHNWLKCKLPKINFMMARYLFITCNFRVLKLIGRGRLEEEWGQGRVEEWGQTLNCELHSNNAIG